MAFEPFGLIGASFSSPDLPMLDEWLEWRLSELVQIAGIVMPHSLPRLHFSGVV